MSLSAADRITKNHIWLMGNPSTMHYSGILMVGEVIITEDVPTAATNGRDVMYNPHFVEGLTDPQIRGLQLHEAGHKCYQHLFLWQSLYKEDAELANQACDYCINLEIKDLDPYGRDIALPEGGLLDEKYRGMDSKQIFELLKEDKANGGQSKGEPMDEHMWQDAQGLPEEERQALAKEIDNAIRQGAFMAGKQGLGAPRSFLELMQPSIIWQDQLRDYVSSVCSGKSDSTWARPNRRYLSMDLYLPSTISETIGAILLVVDTSGSVSQEALTKAIAEIVGIAENCTPDRIDLLYCDSAVAQHETYFEGDYHSLATSTSPKGFGGTDMGAAFEYAKENKLDPVVCVVITDMYTPWPSEIPPYPVIWVDTEGGSIMPSFGSVLRIKS
jgi:predicted metal-dependent peptidase